MLKKLFIVVIATIAVASCKPGVPGRYLSADEMADILYDYHVAEGIAQEQAGRDTLMLRAFKANILASHDVSEADFDSSMVYYTRHTQLLEDVYTKLADRLDKESAAHGMTGSTLASDGVGGDTANVWNANRAFVLSPYQATNRYAFELKTDTSYHAGDRLMLDFNAQFLYQDGIRDASVVLAVTYDNDSTEYSYNMMSSSSHYRVQISNTGNLGIKEIRGFWMLSSDNSQPVSSLTTLKLLVVSNIVLVRMRVNETKNPASSDSIRSVNLDSAAASKAMPVPDNSVGEAADERNGMRLRPVRPNMSR